MGGDETAPDGKEGMEGGPEDVQGEELLFPGRGRGGGGGGGGKTAPSPPVGRALSCSPRAGDECRGGATGGGAG